MSSLDKCLVGEIAAGGNVWSGNCPVGDVSVGEVSVGEMSSRGTVPELFHGQLWAILEKTTSLTSS